MEKHKLKYEIIFISLIFLISIIIMFNGLFNANNNITIKYGVVESVQDNIDYSAPIKIGFEELYINVDGKIMHFSNVLRGNWILDNYFEKGDLVLIIFKDNTPMGVINFWKVVGVVLLVLLFLTIIIFVGKINGIRALISLIFSVSVIFKISLPLIAKNYPPLIVSLFTILIITLVSYFVICGLNKKAIASSLGTVFGVFISGIVAYIFMKIMKLPPGGYSEFVQMILFSGHVLDFYAIFISGVLLASLGAIMDVAIDISSGLFEIKRHKKDISFKELLKSGMNIGTDIMATMANTLILVYIGSIIAPFLYFLFKNTPMLLILNYNIITYEILASLAGSIGVVATIPITALISSYIYTRE